MRQFTIGEACIELGYNRVTLERRMKRLKPPVIPKKGTLDGREFYISEKDIERIRNEYAAIEERRTNVAYLHRNQSKTAALLAEMERLRERVESLETTLGKTRPSASQGDESDGETITDLSHYAAASESRRRPSQGHSRNTGISKRPNRRTTETPEMPDHLIGLTQLCAAHGVHPNTARKQWGEQGVFQVEGPYKIGRAPSAWAVDRENALKAIRHWLAHGEMDAATLGTCGIEQCPCPEIAGEIS